MWATASRLKKSIPIPDFTAAERAQLDILYLGAVIAYYKNGSPEVYDEFYLGSCESFATLASQIAAVIEIAVAAHALMKARRM